MHSSMNFVNKMFEDKRATMVLLVAWMVSACVIFWSLGAFHVHYMSFGPSAESTFMGMTIDNWGKWSALAIFSFLNTAINEFLGSALIPWFTNTIQDHKTKYLPYSKASTAPCTMVAHMAATCPHLPVLSALQPLVL